MKVMIIGSGGREHALAHKLSQSPDIDCIYCVPGNGGTSLESKCLNVELKNIEEISTFALEKNIDYTFVGPEAYLVQGITDIFYQKRLKIIGPDKKASMLESSKAYAKEFMKKYNVRTAAYETFSECGKAMEYILKADFPLVIKADGLAGGKGVVIAQNIEQATETLNFFMKEDIFNGSGKTVVIEEFLEGFEASVLAAVDGKTILPFISAKDHKQVYDGSKGPNTGGMGAIAPNPLFTAEHFEDFKSNIMQPTLRGIREEKLNYKGIIFFGLMVCAKGVYLLEYNVRMGDPETQAVLPLMETDFFQVIKHIYDSDLDGYEIKWKKGSSCCVVAASLGYPGKYETGFEITGYNQVASKVYSAGTVFKNGKLISSGGRVLNVTSLGENIVQASQKAYLDLAKIKFENIYYRNDIGG